MVSENKEALVILTFVKERFKAAIAEGPQYTFNKLLDEFSDELENPKSALKEYFELLEKHIDAVHAMRWDSLMQSLTARQPDIQRELESFKSETAKKEDYEYARDFLKGIEAFMDMVVQRQSDHLVNVFTQANKIERERHWCYNHANPEEKEWLEEMCSSPALNGFVVDMQRICQGEHSVMKKCLSKTLLDIMWIESRLVADIEVGSMLNNKMLALVGSMLVGLFSFGGPYVKDWMEDKLY